MSAVSFEKEKVIAKHQHTVSGASGEALRRELQCALSQQTKEKMLNRSQSENNLRSEGEEMMKKRAIQIVNRYDNPLQPFINAGYDFLQLSSGRDKVRSRLLSICLSRRENREEQRGAARR